MAEIPDFDAETIEPRQAFDLLQPGWYPVQIVRSEYKQTKDFQGKYLELELEILEEHMPENRGRKIFVNLNLESHSAKAQEIAQRDFSALCRSVGVLKVRDTEALHGIPFAVKVKIRKQEGFEDKNEACGYDALAARMGAAAAPAAPAKSTAPSNMQRLEPRPKTAPAAKSASTPAPGSAVPWGQRGK